MSAWSSHLYPTKDRRHSYVHFWISGGSCTSSLSPQGAKDIYEINGNLCK
jgi:hypothetical protein